MFRPVLPLAAIPKLGAALLALTMSWALVERSFGAPPPSAPPPQPGSYIGGYSSGTYRGDTGVFIGGHSNGFYRGGAGVYIGGYSGGYPSDYPGDRRTGPDAGFKGSSTELFPGPLDPNRRDLRGYIRPEDQRAREAASKHVYVTVQVPSDADLWFQGAKTVQKGKMRVFESPTLTPGKSYTYTIRARWTENGRTVDQQREIPVHTGEWVHVDFPGPAK